MSSDLENLRQEAVKIAAGTNDLVKIEKAAQICQLQAEAEKQQVEVESQRRSARSENARFYISVIAPLVSAFAVLGALIFQSVQFGETTRIQRATVDVQKATVEVQAHAAEDAQWREAVKTFTQGQNIVTGLAANALLKAFLHQGYHQKEARSLAVLMLGDIVYIEAFNDLYQALMQYPSLGEQMDEENWEKVKNAVSIDRMLKKNWSETFEREKHLTPPKEGIDASTPTLTTKRGQMIPNPAFQRNQFDREIGVIGRSLAPLLSVPRSHESVLDLTDTAIWDCDWSKVDLNHAVLDNARLVNMKLDGADLSGISSFSDSDWNGTAWWRVRTISPALLEFLMGHYAFKKDQYYGGEKSSQEEFDARVKVLAASSNPQ